jgi:hypothetical protein
MAAPYTQLSPTALPGRRYNFVAKGEAAATITPPYKYVGGIFHTGRAAGEVFMPGRVAGEVIG